jgi:hypothetical protein
MVHLPKHNHPPAIMFAEDTAYDRSLSIDSLRKSPRASPDGVCGFREDGSDWKRFQMGLRVHMRSAQLEEKLKRSRLWISWEGINR